MTEYIRKDKADKLIDKYKKDIDYLNSLICAERVKVQIKELPNCAALQDKLHKQNKKIKNLRKTVKQQNKCIQRMSSKISDDLSKNDYLHFVNWHKYAKEQMKKYHVMGGKAGLSIIADRAPVFYLSPNVDDPYSVFGLLEHNKFRFATDCTQYDWLRGAWSSCPKVYSPFGEDFILVEWLDAPNGKSLLGWIKIEPKMDLHFYR